MTCRPRWPDNGADLALPDIKGNILNGNDPAKTQRDIAHLHNGAADNAAVSSHCFLRCMSCEAVMPPSPCLRCISHHEFQCGRDRPLAAILIGDFGFRKISSLPPYMASIRSLNLSSITLRRTCGCRLDRHRQRPVPCAGQENG